MKKYNKWMNKCRFYKKNQKKLKNSVKNFKETIFKEMKAIVKKLES